LVNDRPVTVDDLWRQVMRAAAGGGADAIVLIHPQWWSSSRIARIRAAASTVAPSVELIERTLVLRDHIAPLGSAIVEIASEFVVVTVLSVAAYVPHGQGAEAVLAAVGAARSALLDAPPTLGAPIGDRLSEAGVAVTVVKEGDVARAVGAMRPRDHDGAGDTDRRPRFNRRSAMVAGAAAVALLCGGFAMRVDPQPAHDVPMALLVEGRLGVMVPAQWTLSRVTSGPGSARVQAVSPSDADVALHITQSTGAEDLAPTARSLRAALDQEPVGSFVDFNASDDRAGRQAVTYREVRRDRHVAWAVVVDGSLRIAIGCQSAPGRAELVREACDEAIRSARAVR
jgi:type VII secretion-associated protein (TIGR03931 family)